MNILKSAIVAGLLSLAFTTAAAPVKGWLSWRGPHQTGLSLEKNLPTDVSPDKALWTADFPGQSTAVIANGKAYIVGYQGDGADLQEGIACFDAETGKKLWDYRYNDFLSDTIYLRYATSSPVIDPATGNVYLQGTQGILAAFTGDGKLLWEKSMMENYGRLTFPNSRTASPIIEQDLLITRGITANWGAEGPGGDRFYAFDKLTGELVWSSSPSDRPRDNSFSQPTIVTLNGKRILIAATGDGSVIGLNARTGLPHWRIPLFKSGINASVVVHNNDKVVAIFGTPYEPGQMVGLKIPQVEPTNRVSGPIVVERAQAEIWANNLSTSTSSPILVDDRVYVVGEKGDLTAVDVNTGKIIWTEKIGIEQRNASPLFADGRLYVPMLEDPEKGPSGESGAHGAFYVIDPSGEKAKILQKVSLVGRCFGSPAVYNGKIYLQTTEKLYCWGKPGNNSGLAPEVAMNLPKPGPATQLQIIPSEALLRPGEVANFRVRTLDANGYPVEWVKDVSKVKWAAYIPATARVRASMKASFNEKGQLVAEPSKEPSAGAFEATLGNLKGYIRGRALPGFPIEQDFEGYALNEKTTNSVEEATAFAYPPLPWIGARFKFEVREKDGNKVLTKTIDNKFFQRATVFLGDPQMRNYTIQADVMSEGNRRKMSDVGVIAQRYLIVLKGNEQKLEVNSNLERLRVPAGEEPSNFKWTVNTWYRLKATVENKPDGTGVVRAKAWKRDEPEPDKWTIEVPHKTSHRMGAPGLFGFSPQDMRVFIDNVVVTENK